MMIGATRAGFRIEIWASVSLDTTLSSLVGACDHYTVILIAVVARTLKLFQDLILNPTLSLLGRRRYGLRASSHGTSVSKLE